jgi:hypothetical protein
VGDSVKLLTDEEREGLRQEYLAHNRLMQRAYVKLRKDAKLRATANFERVGEGS